MSRELLIQCPDGQTKTIPLTGERLAVGRSSAAELCFPEDAGLSRQHFAFESQGEEWTVQDLGSKNGTYLKKKKLESPSLLSDGDDIRMGAVRCKLRVFRGLPSTKSAAPEPRRSR